MVCFKSKCAEILTIPSRFSYVTLMRSHQKGALLTSNPMIKIFDRHAYLRQCKGGKKHCSNANNREEQFIKEGRNH